MPKAMMKLAVRYGQAIPLSKSVKILGTFPMAELKLAHDEKEAQVYSMTRSTNHVTRSVLIGMSMTRPSLVMG